MKGQRLATLRRVCGLPESAFFVHERIVTSLNSMSPVGDDYLIRGRRDKPRFRYCPACLNTMRTPHFPIHWRFVAWRWCPEHDCLLEDTCHQCGHAIVLPIDVESSAAGQRGYALLNRCQSCGASLNSLEPCHLQLGRFRRVSHLEEMTLANGRGLLAALYSGWFEIKGQLGRQRLSQFSEIERYWALPVAPEWLAPENVRKRRPRVARRNLPTYIEGSPNQWQGNGFSDCDLPRDVRIQFAPRLTALTASKKS